MIERVYQYIKDNNSTIYKTKSLTLENFKTVYANATSEDIHFIQSVFDEHGYLPFADQTEFLFRILLNVIANNDKKSFDIMKKHEILPKQSKSKKQIPDPVVLDFIEQVKGKLNLDNVDVLKEVFNAECVFSFYSEAALKELFKHLVLINDEEIIFKLARASVGTTKTRKELYANVHVEIYGYLCMKDMKELRAKLSFLKDKVPVSTVDDDD